MSAAEIIFERVGNLGRIILNRPKALNALTLDQVHAMHPQLDVWANDDSVGAVIIEGAGEKAFCAGGDIRALYEACKAGQMEYVASFYRDEYRLNRKIKTYGKPYIALMDGIVMGGGVGVSVHGRYRVATERTLFAMPETGIGFFSRCGRRLFPAALPRQDRSVSGPDRRTIEGRRLPACRHRHPLRRLGPAGRIARGLGPGGRRQGGAGRVPSRSGTGPLAAHGAVIDRCFAASSFNGVLAALAAEGEGFAADTLAAILAKSPTAGKVAFMQINRGGALDFDACMGMEFRLSQVYAPAADFIEGIRAVIIDKDGKPVWTEAASDEAVTRAFATIPACGDLTF